MTKEKASQGFGIASLVLGIVSIIFLWFPPFAIIAGILAIIFAVIQKKQKPTDIATAGLITGIVGTALGTILLIIMILSLAIFTPGVAETVVSVPLA